MKLIPTKRGNEAEGEEQGRRLLDLSILPPGRCIPRTDQTQFLLKLLLPFAVHSEQERRSWGSPLEADAREPEVPRESGTEETRRRR